MRTRILALASIFALAAALPTGGRSAGADTAAVAPSVSVVEFGPASGSLASLQTVDGNSLVLGPGVTRSHRDYALPGGVTAASIWAFAVKTTWSGPLKTQQVWTWQIRDVPGKKWVKLGDNTDVATAGTPTELRFYPAGPFARYVTAAGVVQIRTVTANKPLTGAIDAESLALSYGAKPTFGGWVPPRGTRWQYQLQPPVDVNVTATAWSTGQTVAPDVFDMDLYEADGVTPAAATVAAIHANGAKAICYVDAGSWENWRPDAAAYPKIVLGASNGWPGEKWLDIRRTDILLPIISARVQKCVDAHFDAVEFDEADGAYNRTGFKLTPSDQVDFDRALADLAHAHGLAVGLKNDVAQLTQLEPWFDFAINEQCQQYAECAGYDAWTSQGKAVAQVEYTTAPATFCPPAITAGRSAIKKALLLQATPYTPCN